jgi:hypothetical protein
MIPLCAVLLLACSSDLNEVNARNDAKGGNNLLASEVRFSLAYGYITTFLAKPS